MNGLLEHLEQLIEKKMNLFITVVSVLMISDAAFTLVNLNKVQSLLHSRFPQINVKKLALVEGVVGLVVLALKIVTGTVS